MNTLILTLFGDKVGWIPQLIENFNKVAQHSLIIFSDKGYKGKGNVRVVDMTIDEYCDLVEEKLGRRPQNTSDPKFWDMRAANGIIFEDYLKGSDYWGFTDHDCVYGNLSKFVNLDGYDVWTNDPYPTICGHLTLWKNTEKVNNLFREYPLWEDMIFGNDVHVWTRPLSGNLSPMSWTTSRLYDEGKLKINYDFDCQSNDKQYHELTWDDGLFSDGREVAIHHFRNTKQWPLQQ